MSTFENEALLLEAYDYLHTGELSGTLLEGLIENDIKNNDLDMLWAHLMQARDMLRDE